MDYLRDEMKKDTGPISPENLKWFSPYFGGGPIILLNATKAVPIP